MTRTDDHTPRAHRLGRDTPAPEQATATGGRRSSLPPEVLERARQVGFPADWLAMLFDHLPDAILANDPHGRLVYANQQGLERLGIESLDALLNLTVSDLARRLSVVDEAGQPLDLSQPPPGDPRADRPMAERLLRLQHPRTGEERVVLMSAVPIRAADGSVVGRLAHSRDTTDATRTLDALHLLAEAGEALASSLDYEETLRRVSRLVVPRLADWCLVHMVNDAGAIQAVAIEHSDPDKLALLREVGRSHPVDWDSPLPVVQVLRSGEPVLLPALSEHGWAEAGLPDAAIAHLRTLGMHSMMFVALAARGRVLGAITLAAAENRRVFTAADLRLAEDLARRAALAVDRSRLYAAEQGQRRAAERAARRADRLLRVTAALSEAVTPDQVARAVAVQGAAAVHASAALVTRVDEPGEALVLMHAEGVPADLEAAWQRIPLRVERPLTRAVLRQETVTVSGPAEAERAFPELAALAAERGWRSFVAIPLAVSGRVLGAIGFGFAGDRPITDDRRAFLTVLGQLSAQALERARLYDAELAARAQAEDARRRLTLLSHAGAVLGSSLDAGSVLQTLSELVVRELATGCVIHQTDEQERLVAVAIAHHDAELEARLRRVLTRAPVALTAPTPLADVVRHEVPLVWSQPTGDKVASLIPGPGWATLVPELGSGSVLAVPLTTHGQALGTMTLLQAPGGEAFLHRELTLVRALAQRAAAAIDNARIYRRSRAQTRRMSIIAEFSRALAEAPLDVATVLETVARCAAELVGDHCVVTLIGDEPGNPGPFANYHADPTRRAAVANLLPPSRGHAIAEVISKVTASGAPLLLSDLARDERVEAATRARLAALGIVSMMAVPLRVGGQITGTLAFARDRGGLAYGADDLSLLTELADRVAMTVESARLYREAQAAVHARDEFLSIASHELKTPLTTIKAYAQMLARALRAGRLEAERLVGFIDHLQSQVWRLEILVRDLLDASRIQQGRLDLRTETMDLLELTQEAVERLDAAPEWTPSHRVVIDQAGPVVGDWDPARIDQVLTNLLSNAVKYSPDGGEIRVAVLSQGDRAVLTVRDHGIGISPAERAALFEPFARGDSARLRASGSGLGLFISARIVAQHGGQITVESEVGRGTTFSVFLPLERTRAI